MENFESAEKLKQIRKDFSDDGKIQPENVEFLFAYIEALESALALVAGTGDKEDSGWDSLVLGVDENIAELPELK